MVKSLDNLAEKNGEKLAEMSKKYPKIPEAKFTSESGNLSFKNKSLFSTVKKYTEKYHVYVSPDVFPKISEWKVKCHNNYLIKSRSSTTTENFRDQIANIICDKKVLQERLVSVLKKANDIVEAKYWAQKYDLHDEFEELENLLLDPISFSKCDSHTQDEFLELPVSQENIYLVDSREKLLDFMERMEFVEVVGLDTEGKKPSLIQVSLTEEVFLLDFEVLPLLMVDSDYEILKTALFLNNSITIVGFAIQGDIKDLAKSFKQFEDLPKHCQNILDLQEVQSSLIELLEPEEPFQPQGLSHLCQRILGKPLNKSEQRSDWTKRPLSASKITYAALDAWVSVEIYRIIQNRAKSIRREVEFIGIINEGK